MPPIFGETLKLGVAWTDQFSYSSKLNRYPSQAVAPVVGSWPARQVFTLCGARQFVQFNNLGTLTGRDRTGTSPATHTLDLVRRLFRTSTAAEFGSRQYSAWSS